MNLKEFILKATEIVNDASYNLSVAFLREAIHIIISQQSDIKKLREALEFYSNENNYTKDGIIFETYWHGNDPLMKDQVQDYGNIARKALGES